MQYHNIIIAQNLILVNDDSKRIAKRPEILDRWEEKKAMTSGISRKMEKAGYKERGKRMAQCSNILIYDKCPDCGKWQIKRANLCRDRMCPVCSWRLALQRFGEMRRLMTAIQSGYPEITEWSLVTLTVRNCTPENLNATMEKMSTAWNLTINQRQMKQVVFGWARSTEITYNEKTHTLHPHYHIIVGWYKEESRKMVDFWLSACTKYGMIVDIKAQDATSITTHTNEKGAEERAEADTELSENLLKSILETFKYSVKSKDLDEMPLREFRTVVAGVSGKRLVSYGGKIREYAKLCRLNMETVEDETNIDMCKNCGGIDMEKIIYRWSYGKNAYTVG